MSGASAARAVRPADEAGAARIASSSRTQVQRATAMSRPGDASEREAESTARTVMAMRLPGPVTVRNAGIARAAGATPAAAPARAASASPMVQPAIAERVRQAATGGQPLPGDLRGFMEPRFRADFGAVRLHTDASAAALATALGARAFTYERHIFFGRGEYRPETRGGMELIAHELTHTIQQRAAIQRQAAAPVAQAPRIAERPGSAIQRLGVRDVLDFFADRANAIPGYRLLTIVIGTNPINQRPVERSAANILRAVVEFLPGGNLITTALDRYGVFDRVGNWIESQLASLGITSAALRAALDQFINSLSWTDVFDLGGVWDRARSIFGDIASRILSFVRSLAGAVLGFIRDAILRPLAELASRTRAWDLLCALLGRNPITGEAVPRTAETLIGGFMHLIGQDEIWQNIQRSGAIGRAWAWFQTAMSGLMGIVSSIPGRFIDALRSLEIGDLVNPLGAFGRVAGAIGGFIGDFLSWAGGTIWNLLEIIFSVVAPEVITYLQRARAAFRTILQNPGRFVGTLIRAVVQGFRQFAANFLTHLRAGLIGWLTGALSGAAIYIPQGFSLFEILKFILSVLGLTWANIRAKLVRATSEGVVGAMEQGFAIVRTLVTEGPAAAWQQIVAGLANLRDMVIEQVMDYVKGQIVQIAITRLLASLNPAGAFIQAILAIYNTVMFLVERIRQIGRVAASVIDAIAAIASGIIGPAANRVEQTAANLLPLVISFLARLVGLGNVGQVITRFLARVRAPIDRGLDRVVAWIVAQARRLGRFVAQAGVPQDPRERLRLASRASLAIASRLPRTGLTAPLIARAHDAIKVRYGLTELTPYQQSGAWYVRAVINPPLVWRLPVPGETAGTGGIGAVATRTGPGGVMEAGVRGELRPGITRRGMESALPAAGALPGLAASYLQGYRRAHLYGPGFGDETAIGLTYASAEVNNELQSTGSKYGIEGYARQIRERVSRLGGRAAVEVVATSYPDPPRGVPQPLGQPVLRQVGYTFIVINGAGAEVSLPRGRATATITAAPPLPNGAGGQGTAFVTRLDELNNYLGSRSTRTGL